MHEVYFSVKDIEDMDIMPTINDVCRAVRKGDIEELKRLTSGSHDIDLNETSEWFEPGWFGSTVHFSGSKDYGSSAPSAFLGPMTPLMIAAAYGHYECVDYLVNHCKVNLDTTGGRRKGYTALDCAIYYKANYNKDAAERIIKLLKSKRAKKIKYNIPHKASRGPGARGISDTEHKAEAFGRKVISDEIEEFNKNKVRKKRTIKYASIAVGLGVVGYLIKYGLFSKGATSKSSDTSVSVQRPAIGRIR